jgi:hypothetical protein
MKKKKTNIYKIKKKKGHKEQRIKIAKKNMRRKESDDNDDE